MIIMYDELKNCHYLFQSFSKRFLHKNSVNISFAPILITYSADHSFSDFTVPMVRVDLYKPQSSSMYEGVPRSSGLATWSKNCKWYTSMPLATVVSLFCESV
jgi:hypothetical protein